MTKLDIDIRPISDADAESVTRIYNHYITHTIVTFETEPVESVEILDRIRDTRAAGLPWIVAESGTGLAGFAYASRWKGRCAYRFSVESSIYLDAGQTGHGLGKRLYAHLIDEIRAISMHSVIGGISLPNDASVRLHEKLGFKKIGQFEQVGHKFERWIDVGYWQLLL